MSFGIGVGDFIAVSTHALKLYWAYRDAPGEFAELCRELLTLHTTLSQLQNELSDPSSTISKARPHQQEHLARVLNNCDDCLDELETVHAKYYRLGGKKKRGFSWDRVKFAGEKVGEIRGKLALHTTAVGVFLQVVSHTSLSRIEMMISGLAERVEEVLRVRILEGSVCSARASSCAVESDCSEEVEEIIEALEEEGVPKEELRRNVTVISAYVEHRVEEESRNGCSCGHRSPWMGSVKSLTFEDVAVHEREPQSPISPARSIFEIGMGYQPTSFYPTNSTEENRQVYCRKNITIPEDEISPPDTPALNTVSPNMELQSVQKDTSLAPFEEPPPFTLSPPTEVVTESHPPAHQSPRWNPHIFTSPDSPALTAAEEDFTLSACPSPRPDSLPLFLNVNHGLATPPDSPFVTPCRNPQEIQPVSGLATSSHSSPTPPSPVFCTVHVRPVPTAVEQAHKTRYVADVKRYLTAWSCYEQGMRGRIQTIPETNVAFIGVEESRKYQGTCRGTETLVKAFSEALNEHRMVLEHWHEFLLKHGEKGARETWKEAGREEMRREGAEVGRCM